MKILFFFIIIIISIVSSNAQMQDSVGNYQIIKIRAKTSSRPFQLQHVGISGGVTFGNIIGNDGEQLYGAPFNTFHTAPNLINKGKYPHSSRIGFHLAINSNFYLSEYFSFQPEVHFTQKNFSNKYVTKLDNDNSLFNEAIIYKQNIKPGFLELPMLIKASTNGFRYRIYILTGVSTAINIYKKERVKVPYSEDVRFQHLVKNTNLPKSDTSYNYLNHIDKVRLGWVGAIGSEVRLSDRLKLTIEARYVLDLNKNLTISGYSDQNQFQSVIARQGCIFISTGLNYTFKGNETNTRIIKDKKLVGKLQEYERTSDPNIRLNHIALTAGMVWTSLNTTTHINEQAILLDKKSDHKFLTVSYIKSINKLFYYEAGITGGIKNYRFSTKSDVTKLNNYPIYNYNNVSNIIFSGVSGKMFYGEPLNASMKWFVGFGVNTGLHFRTYTNYSKNDTVWFGNDGVNRLYIFKKNNFSRVYLNNTIETGMIFRLKNNQLIRWSLVASFEYIFRNVTDYSYNGRFYSEGKLAPSRLSFGTNLSYTFGKIKKK